LFFSTELPFCPTYSGISDKLDNRLIYFIPDSQTKSIYFRLSYHFSFIKQRDTT
jgi:hypothetical protein